MDFSKYLPMANEEKVISGKKKQQQPQKKS